MKNNTPKHVYWIIGLVAGIIVIFATFLPEDTPPGKFSVDILTSDPELIKYVKLNKLESVANFFDENKNVDPRDAFGYSALHWATNCGNMEIMRFLLSKGAKINCQSSVSQITPLMLGAARGNKEVVWYLFDHGANPLIRDRNDRTAFHYAYNRKFREEMRNYYKKNK